YVDLLLPRQRLWIAGAGHVGRALARHASEVEFEVHMVDDRPDLNSAENIPHAAEHVVGDIETELGRLELGTEDYVVVVTRGHRHDLDALRAVVRSGARYVGLIGSRRKIKLLNEALVEAGEASEEDLERVYAPIGLDIGAVTVDEIAVCITAELIAIRRGVLGSPAERWRAPKRRRGACAG
ncbi:MAG: XdhC family protein, partial [Armatimonadetes bacterium]|nr:XdhC family protein [Armatimonadota bacterium]